MHLEKVQSSKVARARASSVHDRISMIYIYIAHNLYGMVLYSSIYLYIIYVLWAMVDAAEDARGNTIVYILCLIREKKLIASSICMAWNVCWGCSAKTNPFPTYISIDKKESKLQRFVGRAYIEYSLLRPDADSRVALFIGTNLFSRNPRRFAHRRWFSDFKNRTYKRTYTYTHSGRWLSLFSNHVYFVRLLVFWRRGGWFGGYNVRRKLGLVVN